MATAGFYQKTTIGKCLVDSLDEMVKNETLKPEHAFQVLLQFDKSMAEAVKMHAAKDTFSIKGNIDWYNYHDHIWTFVLRDALIKSKTPFREICEKKIDRLKVVAKDSAEFK